MSVPSAQDQAIEAIARQAVAEVSPAELPIFSATAARYRADPQGTLAASPVGDRALGFGIEAAVVLVTPYALELVKRIFKRLSEKVGDSAGDSLADRITSHFGGKPDAAAAPAHPEPLTPEQLALISETTRAEAADLALAPAESERLADAVVAALATRT